jgi:hypothetical protein
MLLRLFIAERTSQSPAPPRNNTPGRRETFIAQSRIHVAGGICIRCDDTPMSKSEAVNVAGECHRASRCWCRRRRRRSIINLQGSSK